MGLNRLGPKKTRRLRNDTGLDIYAASVWSDGRVIVASVGSTWDDHYHVIIDRRTGEIERDENGGHFTSCDHLPGSPFAPPPGL